MININKIKSNSIKNTTVNFITFADTRFRSSLRRIKRQAQNTRVIDNVKLFDQSYLLKFKDHDSNIFKYFNKSNRGYGYWAWKPLIIKDELYSLNDNDILIYADAGFHINSQGNLKLIEYINSLTQDTPILLFGNNAKIDNNLEPPVRGLDWKNYQYIKKETLNFFNLIDNFDFLNNQQIAGGLIILLNNKISRNFIDEWYEVVFKNFNLIDSELREKQCEGFIAHRHDQAILSCLSWLHKKNIIFRSIYEMYYPKYKDSILKSDWCRIEDYPFHARRDLGFVDYVLKRMQTRLKKYYERIKFK